ncbi:MAG: GGDEF domain-containing protein [Thermodesulfobacteriota bacterium]
MNSGKVSYEELEQKVKLLEERISALIRHDPVTGLHNKKAFLERLEEGLIHAARYGNTKSILLVRLDRFDEVRQRFGEGIAEMFIKRIARKLRNLFRESDYLARLSGSEFGVILGNPHKATPKAVRRKIHETLTPPFEMGGARIEFVSVSVGIGVFPKDGEDIDTLLRQAAEADEVSEK